MHLHTLTHFKRVRAKTYKSLQDKVIDQTYQQTVEQKLSSENSSSSEAKVDQGIVVHQITDLWVKCILNCSLAAPTYYTPGIGKIVPRN